MCVGCVVAVSFIHFCGHRGEFEGGVLLWDDSRGMGGNA